MEPEPDASLALCHDLLHQFLEQILVKGIQPFRPGLYGVRRLMQPADGVLDIVMFQQAAAFSPKLGELDVDGIQLGGAGIRVQQPAACSLLMLWLCSAAWAMAG